MSFVVVGAGVVGLTTALELQKNFPNARVNVIADKFGVDTTSDVAAGIFRPGPSFSGPTDDITRSVMSFQLQVTIHFIHSHSPCHENLLTKTQNYHNL